MNELQLDGTTKHLLCKLLVEKVSQYLQDEEHRKEFEKWYFQKYGKKYKWKTLSTQA